ncbi:MAG: peptidase T [Oscillospiraceae bacterium]|nr:peptidase T [Oscillospiraceae bacterium]
MTVIDRFLKLVSYPTTSDERSETCPSTPRQLALAEELVRQMQELGIQDARVDAYGYVYGTIPANCEKDIPVYGLIAHMDTAPDAPGENIRARVTEAYDGGDVMLNEEKHIVLSPEEYPQLKNAVGKRLIVTDGTTLLGADDKAGVAEILSAAELLLTSDRKHGAVKLAFTPDEEIGRGADRFDVAGFGADYAYTVDGGAIGELEYENFNAASAKIVIRGKSIHPGSAKGQMVNAALVAMELHGLLPALETPYYTDGYEGFYHLTDLQGETEQAELQYIIRDHDRAKFEARKAVMQKVCAEIDRRYGAGTVELTLRDSYYNMKEKIEPCLFLIENAKQAMEQLGIEPKVVPIRGGTDGARLSFEGLPCPNLCTGGENFHGRFEYIPAEDMERITQLLAVMLWNLAE